jgi:hypothetical protein
LKKSHKTLQIKKEKNNSELNSDVKVVRRFDRTTNKRSVNIVLKKTKAIKKIIEKKKSKIARLKNSKRSKK